MKQLQQLVLFFKTTSPLSIAAIGLVMMLIAKLIEIKWENVALFFQLFSFVLLVYGLIRFFNRKF